MEHHSKERVPTLEIYTDGSCKRLGTITFGGWSFVVIRNDEFIYQGLGSEDMTTNQRMELTAVANALEYAASIRRPVERVKIYSDSAYIINCFDQEWYVNWLKNGWVGSTGREVANKELWMRIIPFFDNYWYTFSKVPGHKDCFWNIRADELAQNEAEKNKIHWRGTNGRNNL